MKAGEGATRHLRPFFPSAADFATQTTPHFRFLVDELGFSQPQLVDTAADAFDIRYDGKSLAVLLSWEVEGGFFACQLIPRLAGGELEPDYERWLSPNEILAARGAIDAWVTQADLDNVDELGYGQVMDRVAGDLQTYCADVLAGDWAIYNAAHHWLERLAGN